MATFYSPKVTLIDESEINFTQPNILGLAIIIKIPHLASGHATSNNINRHTIHEAIQQQTHVAVSLDKISHYGPHYLLIAESPAPATRIMNKLSITSDTCRLGLMPWTLDYDATTIDIDNNIPTTETAPVHIQQPGNNQELDIRILGLPPHLCHEDIVRRLFTNICHVKDIEYDSLDLTFSLKTYAPMEDIPGVAHIAIHRRTPAGAILQMWLLWYEVMTLEMQPGYRQIVHQPANAPAARNKRLRFTLYQQPEANANPSNAPHHSTQPPAPLRRTDGYSQTATNSHDVNHKTNPLQQLGPYIDSPDDSQYDYNPTPKRNSKLEASSASGHL